MCARAAVMGGVCKLRQANTRIVHTHPCKSLQWHQLAWNRIGDQLSIWRQHNTAGIWRQHNTAAYQ
eukprot:SAG31_NODE_2155_length_6311_cov_3.139086_4_plen_66_part_00